MDKLILMKLYTVVVNNMTLRIKKDNFGPKIIKGDNSKR